MKDKKDVDMAPNLLRAAMEKMPPFKELPSIETIRATFHLPGTIEDEIPPLPQHFVDKVKAEGGIITAAGLLCDTSVPVVGKRYMRLAKALFCTMYNDSMRNIEDMEYRIRNYAKRNKAAPDWENMNFTFGKILQFAFKCRHNPTREPIYANKG